MQRLASPLREINNALQQFGCELRVAMPGVLTAFDSARQVVSVQPAIQERISQNVKDASGNIVPVATYVNLPELPNVPVLLYGGGGYTVCPPFAAGDECLVIFSDSCIDAWWQQGGTQNPEIDRRRHDLSDGFALIGVRSQPRKLANYKTTALQIRSDDQSVLIEIGPTGIVLTNASGGVTVNGSLTVNGAITVTGTAALDGNTTIQTRPFLSHEHTGVTTGAGVTGGVV